MSSAAIQMVVRMMEKLLEDRQDQVVEHLRAYLNELLDEIEWDEAFAKTQPQLAAAARRAREQKSAGLAQPLDPDKL